MISKVVKYTDFNGELQEEELFFHLSKTELLEMEAETPGGLEAHLKEIVKRGDPSELVQLFRKFLLAAYGKKSEDGKRFLKNDELRIDFLNSPAYDELFFALATEGDAATEFFFGMVPADFAKQIREMRESGGPEDASEIIADLPEDDRPAYVREDREPTSTELANMSKAELTEAFRVRQQRGR